MLTEPDSVAAQRQKKGGAVVDYRVRSFKELMDALRDVRRSDGALTQQQLADRLGVSRSYVADMETGRSNRLIDLTFDVLRVLDLELVIRRRGGEDA
jgi:DNA-binding XRE family transcriptional regulator